MKKAIVNLVGLSIAGGTVSAVPHFHTDFDEASLGSISGLNKDTPAPANNDYSLNTANDTLDFVGNSANMWTTRDNAPFAWVAAPVVAVGDTWFVETQVNMANRTGGSTQYEQVGMTFYGGPDGANPGGDDSFIWGINGWNAWETKLQGLADNNPSIAGAIGASATNVFLRTEITEGGATDTYNFFYKENAGDSWTQLGGAATDYANDVDNSRVALFLKTHNNNTTATAQFDYFTVDVVSVVPPADSDSDGLEDAWELANTGAPGNLTDLTGLNAGPGPGAATGDFDGDGRSDLQEFQDGTNPILIDSDGDGLSDGQESSLNTDPLDADTDGDGLADGQEANTFITDPLDNDSDNDGFTDGDEVTAGTDPNSGSSFPVVTVDRPTPKSTNTTRDSVVVFNEIHYHPAGDDGALEYVELYNQLSVNVDLSNWRIGGLDYDFPEGTVIDARSYLVIAKVPANYPGALGPFAGSLSNSGETLRLFNNNRAFRTTAGAGPVGAVTDSLDRRRIMDEVSYGDTYPWALGPDGSGSTLAKIDPMTGSAHPRNWTHSAASNGTPGAANIQAPLPSIAFNEIAASTAPAFQIEIVNHGALSISIAGVVIASSNPAHSDYTLPATALPAGGFTTIDAATLGYTPDDNNRLFLFSIGKTTLIDTARVDDRLKGRSPDGTGRWLNPDSATFGSGNAFTFEDSIVINEIFYNAYPVRSTPGTPPTYSNVQVMDYDHVWRYNLDAGVSGLPSGWEDSAHAVDNVSWSQGSGLLGFETGTLDEPILTNVTKETKVPYYFETEFVYNDPETVDQIQLEHYVDDGAVFYLNGEEIGRFNLSPGTVTPTTLASGVGNAALETLTVDNPNILQGSNRLSVEVHQSSVGSSDLILGVRAQLRKIQPGGSAGTPYAERDEEWLELYNRGSATIDLSAWDIEGGISYNFPAGTMLAPGDYLVVAKDAAALALKHPGITIVGEYSGKLGNGGEYLVLEDGNGNPADEVTYFDAGKWADEADGGGSSLELRDPDSDNAVAGAWAASDESSRNTWNTYTYEGVAVDDGIGDNIWHELQIGLLDAGELLIDDVSVIENGSIEMIQNGDFESDGLGSTADKWRAIGTHGSHGKTVVVADPDVPANRCLHLVASGPTGNKHDKLETTFANSEQITPGATYRISFRAKFISGSNQLNTRLYFNYLQRTTNIAASAIWGTPGVVNSRAVANAGPSLEALAHAPVVPDANQAVNVAIDAVDADGINDLTLFYSIAGGAFQSSPMSAGADGLRFVGSIPGQSASTIVQFYVRARDTSNATTLFPAAGPDGGAFYKVEDGYAETSGVRHNFRIVMSEADRQFLFLNTNRMSNDRFPVTVIEDETTAYYDVALRLKASGHGRYSTAGYGFNISFQPDRLFRGAQSSISIERAGDKKEILAKHLMNRSGGTYQSFYDDVAYVITPTTGDRGRALLSMARHTSSFWDGIFPNEEEPGTLFNHELHYSPNTTDGGPEGLKIGNPYNHTNGRYDLIDRGLDKEPYRWGFQIRSARGRDDYSQLIAVNQAMGNLSGTALKNALEPIIDVDQWMRTLAMMSLNGTDDIFTRIWEHNFRFYVRPTDGRVVILQWDLDRSFRLGTSSSIIPTTNNSGTVYTLTKLFAIPEYRRLFDGHLEDLVQTTFNSDYVATWAAHFNSIAGSSNQTSYINNRANYALTTLPANVPFAITTNGGNDFSEADSAIDLEGDGWVDVFTVEVNGIATPVTWTDSDSWMVTVPIGTGPNPLVLTAFDYHGEQVGSDTITVTNTSAIDLADASNTVISELHYHPADPTAAEIGAGFTDADDFEFVELTNISATNIDLTNAAFTDGVTFTFPPGNTLAPGARLVVVSNQAAFEFRYGAGAVTVAGTYTGSFRNSGEHVLLAAADTSPIADFTYGDSLPWPDDADGAGYSLVFAGDDPNDPLHWFSSTSLGGSPGATDSTPYPGGDVIDYALAADPYPEIVGDTFVLNVRVNLAATGAGVGALFSTDLEDWTPAPISDLISRTNNGDGTATWTFQTPLPRSTTSRQFGRGKVTLLQP